MPRPGDNIHISLSETEALRLMLKVKPTADTSRPGAPKQKSPKVDQYDPQIMEGLPLDRAKTGYNAKMVKGALRLMAAKIKHGEYMEISAGLAGKFREIVHSRG